MCLRYWRILAQQFQLIFKESNSSSSRLPIPTPGSEENKENFSEANMASITQLE